MNASGPRPVPDSTPPDDEDEGLGDNTLVNPLARSSAPRPEDRAGPRHEPDDGADTAIFERPPAEAAALPSIPGIPLSRELGRGGMGVVYEGRQGYLDRRVAVKLLSEQCTDAGFTARFQREAKILASLTHPNIVACYQAGIAPGGQCFLAMEFIDGPDLAGWIDQHGPLEPQHALLVCRGVARALQHAHESGIIHRDVKPANVLLQRDDSAPSAPAFPYRPKLVDLGLARQSSPDSSMIGLTAQNTVMGSPPTMAPEQFDDPDKVDFRTDIYGLGCVLYHCLSGKPAFPQSSITTIIASKMQGDPPDPRRVRPDLSPGLTPVVARMLARERERRPQSYAEVLDLLEAPFDAALRRRSPALVVGAVVALAVLGVGGYAGLSAWLGDAEEPVVAEAPQHSDDSRAVEAPRQGEEPKDEELTPTGPQEPPEPIGGSQDEAASGSAPPAEPSTQVGTEETVESTTLQDAALAGQLTEGVSEEPQGPPESSVPAGDEAPGDTARATDEQPHEDPGPDERPASPAGLAEPEGAGLEPESATAAAPLEEELDLAPALEPGEQRQLFRLELGEPFELRARTSRAGDWVLTGAADAWTNAGDPYTVLAFAEESANRASCALPAGDWKLQGSIDLYRTVIARCAVHVGWSDDASLVLAQSKSERRAPLELAARWEAGAAEQTREPPRLTALSPPAREGAEPDLLDLSIEWRETDGRLIVEWGTQAGRAAQEWTRESGLTGRPVLLGLEVEGGKALFRRFLLELP